MKNQFDPRRQKTCPSCGGKGTQRILFLKSKCSRCGGSGQVYDGPSLLGLNLLSPATRERVAQKARERVFQGAEKSERKASTPFLQGQVCLICKKPKAWLPCIVCGGTGRSVVLECSNCQGTGEEYRCPDERCTSNTIRKPAKHKGVCPHCGGTGRMHGGLTVCRYCSGGR